jgi:hypothetical protein
MVWIALIIEPSLIVALPVSVGISTFKRMRIDDLL